MRRHHADEQGAQRRIETVVEDDLLHLGHVLGRRQQLALGRGRGEAVGMRQEADLAGRPRTASADPRSCVQASSQTVGRMVTQA